MKTIPLFPLKHGKLAIVDDRDFERLSRFRWNSSFHGYVTRSEYVDGHQFTAHMAHQILPPKEGFTIDHKNGDKLDNRKENLRYATSSQQACNRKRRRDNTTGFKGVERRKRGFVARIVARGERFNLGTFDTAELAGAAYYDAATRLHGEFSRTE